MTPEILSLATNIWIKRSNFSNKVDRRFKNTVIFFKKFEKFLSKLKLIEQCLAQNTEALQFFNYSKTIYRSPFVAFLVQFSQV